MIYALLIGTITVNAVPHMYHEYHITSSHDETSPRYKEYMYKGYSTGTGTGPSAASSDMHYNYHHVSKHELPKTAYQQKTPSYKQSQPKGLSPYHQSNNYASYSKKPSDSSHYESNVVPQYHPGKVENVQTGYERTATTEHTTSSQFVPITVRPVPKPVEQVRTEAPQKFAYHFEKPVYKAHQKREPEYRKPNYGNMEPEEMEEAAGDDYYDPHPKYKYEYQVDDKDTGDYKTFWEERDGDVVRGAYTIMDADGKQRIVEYKADKVNGYEAVIRRVGQDGQYEDEYKSSGYRKKRKLHF